MAPWGRAGRTSRFRLLSLHVNIWWRSISSEVTSSSAVAAGGSRRGHLFREKCSIPLFSPNRFDPFGRFIATRSFAAPASAKKAKDKDTDGGPRLNENIVSEHVRLVTDDGHRIITRLEALRRAKTAGHDLVEVDHLADPPVCKIMDYHQERYKKAAKEKERAKSKTETSLRTGECKEVRFKGKIEQKDLEMKAETVKRLMESGYRVKIMAEATKKAGSSEEDLDSVLSRLYKLIENISAVEGAPRVEKRVAYVIVRHAKFGTKKNPAKKVGSTSETNGTKIPPYPQEDTNVTLRQEKVPNAHHIHVHSSGKAGSPDALLTSKPFHFVPPPNSEGIRNEQNQNRTDLKSVPAGVRPELNLNSEQPKNRYVATSTSNPLPDLSNRYKKSNPTGQPARGRMQQPPPFRRNEGMLNSNKHDSPGGANNHEGLSSQSFNRHQNHNRYPPNTNYNGPNPPKNFGRINTRQESNSNPTGWKRDQENAP